MFDRALVFFYGLILLLAFLSVRKIKRDAKSKFFLAYVLFIIVIIMLIPFFYNIDPTFGWIYLLFSVFVFLLLCAVIFNFLTIYLRNRRLKNIVRVVKNEGVACLDSLFLNEPDGHWYSLYWHVLYFPAQNTLEIGASIFHSDIKINKKFYSKTLSGRTMYIIPESLLGRVTLERSALYPLKMFMQHSEEATELVTRYIDAIKNGSSEPWMLFEPKVVSADGADAS